jgi:uncharacterized SAM-binding protein YcdF (DUF218 family)
MFYLLSKVLDAAVDPLWWAGVCLAFVLLGLAKGKPSRHARLALSLGLLILVGFSLPPVSNRLWASLEAGARSTVRADVTYDAVVLLGGAVAPGGSTRDEPAWNDNVERLLTVRDVLVHDRAKVAVLSGGALGGTLRPEAEYLADALVALGVPRERLVLESRSLNTKENAALVKPLLETLQAHRVLVVTSAFHAPRAQGCFTAVGLQVDLLPVDYRLRPQNMVSDSHLAPRAEYLGQSARALREWLGRFSYWALGYSK